MPETPLSIPEESPFHPERDDLYRPWREAKLADYPAAAGDLVVEVADPRRLSKEEHAALLARLRKTNMALLSTPLGGEADKAIPRRLGEQFGLVHLDSNYLADDDGISSLTVNPEAEHARYIPYTNRGINWHTDGYYNTPERQIRGLILHCVAPAAEGGGNALLDPEIAYLRLRDADPAHIRALAGPAVMTIPPGKDDNGNPRGASVGPVFSVDPATGTLHMRYTARKRNIEWNPSPAVQAALAALEAVLASDPLIFRARLEAGMSLICNNVLHDRGAFEDRDGVSQRLLYRARYFDRIAGTELRGR